MKTVISRIARLENQFGTADGRPQILFTICRAGCGPALDGDRWVEILRETGSLPTGRMGVLSFLNVPSDLNAEETERYLRAHATEVCDPRRSLIKVNQEANDP
jgi:hypothetical protein